jgi:hypothetical protein
MAAAAKAQADQAAAVQPVAAPQAVAVIPRAVRAGHSMSSTNSGHTATASKGSHSATDPAQSGTNAHFQEGRLRVFVQPAHGSGYNSQNTGATSEDQRKHKRLFLGFIRY